MRITWQSATVRVPATSGNLGPGFDSMGMAHAIYDEVTATLVAGASSVEILGEGQGELPTDESHLVVRALKRGLEYAGAPLAGVKLTCHNAIPQSRGMGSSAAAVVAGLGLAAALIDRPSDFGPAQILALATEFEGHPDNAAPAVYGGAVVSWVESGVGKAVKLPLHPGITPTLLIPAETLPTSKARAALPATVPHVDAAFNVSRAALLVHGLSRDPSVLFDATDDRLHQDYRSSSMKASFEVLQALRQAGWPAVISGAGPSVLVLDRLDDETARILHGHGFLALTPGVGEGLVTLSKE